MFTRISQFIASLRTADNATKKNWIIGASAVSMVFVILLWLVYLTLTLPSLPSDTNTETGQTAAATETAPSEPTFFSTFSRGISVLIHQSEAGLAAFASKIAENVETIKKSVEKKNVIEVKGPEPSRTATTPATTTAATSTEPTASTSTPQ